MDRSFFVKFRKGVLKAFLWIVVMILWLMWKDRIREQDHGFEK